jgi:hypothetical protein
MMKRWLCGLLLSVVCGGSAVLEAKILVPKQQMEQLRAAGWDELVGKGVGIWISVARQRLYLIKDYHLYSLYPCSTASAGIGNKAGSYQTPLGWHKIAERIGDGLPKGAILKERHFSGKVWNPLKPTSDDLILSRILWLQGTEPGTNLGSGIDTHDRYIYIHGTPEEDKLGTPVSHGCIRLSNDDVITLFNQTKTGMPLIITRW